MKADIFNGENTFGEKYRDFFFKYFEWAVFENDMKWKAMERWKVSLWETVNCPNPWRIYGWLGKDPPPLVGILHLEMQYII